MINFIENASCLLTGVHLNRAIAEQRYSDLLNKLEETQSSYHKEKNELREQLDAQKQLVATSDQKVQ